MQKVIFDPKKKIHKLVMASNENQILAKSKDKIRLYNKVIKCANILFKIFCLKKYFLLTGIIIIKDLYKLTNDNPLYFKVNKKKYLIENILKLSIFSYKFIIYKCKINYRDFEDANIHNKLFLSYQGKNGYGFLKAIKYNFLLGDNTKDYFGPIKILKETNTSIYIRRSTNNKIFVTVRLSNKTDKSIEKIKILLAKITSIFMSYKNVILMYEKEASRYEESSAVLFEKIIDLGYKNVYFVIDKNIEHLSKINKKYLKKIIYKCSFKHYLYFFLTKTFIGSETIPHSIDLRVANRYIYKKISDKKYNFIFLQHGITYMISLASTYRKSFQKGNSLPPNTKIVVSSEEEANHFIKYGGYDKKDLYISGMPKFDRNIKYKNADKIIVMPTWRPWEYNEIRVNFKETGYYKMLMNIINGVPERLKNKLIVLPHPLFMEAVKDSNFPNFIPQNKTYDELLREASLLITDYSSIAFDAFYRGSNVIFWWQDKEECMKNYGGFLMLNEKNAFGDIAYNTENLKKLIKKNYLKKQDQKYIKNFRKIVEFNDNQNTNRLIDMLVKDGILKK